MGEGVQTGTSLLWVFRKEGSTDLLHAKSQVDYLVEGVWIGFPKTNLVLWLYSNAIIVVA